MTKIFKVPFATQGDRTAVPDEIQADGSLSYTQGYGYDYERDQITDPAAKDIEREKMNGLFHDITEAVGEIQTFGVPAWSAEGRPYPIKCIVYHGNKVWQSLTTNNTAIPSSIAATAWAELKADMTAEDVGAQAAGYSYSKTESDGRYQPKGNYASTADLEKKLDKTSVFQTTGTSTTGTISQKGITDALKNAVNIDTIYPVGVVIWFAQNKNPNSLFPGTTWSYIGENKTIRLASSSGNNVLSSGGSDSITLTAAHLPAHSHSFSGSTSSFDYGTKTSTSGGDHTHPYSTLNYNTGSGYDVGGNSNSGWNTRTTSSAGAHTHNITIGAHTHTMSGTTGNTGNGSSVSVINAYIMLMGWYRIE